MYSEIQALRERINRRAAYRRAIQDFALFVIAPLFVGLAIEGML